MVSSTTPPYSGTDAPETPLRPPAAVTGTRAWLQAVRTAATWEVDVGRTTAPARRGTIPASDQCSASGHQSRLASATCAVSVIVSQIESSRSSSDCGSGVTSSMKRCPVPASSIGGVGDVIAGAGW